MSWASPGDVAVNVAAYLIQTDAGGEFDSAGLGGAYTSMSKPGYEAETLVNQSVVAARSRLGKSRCPLIRAGHLSGSVRPNNANITVESNTDGQLCPVAYGVNGVWNAADCRIGQYTVTGEAMNYVTASDCNSCSGRNHDCESDLAIDYGCLVGHLVLDDGATNYSEVRLSLVETGQSLNSADTVGRFETAGLERVPTRCVPNSMAMPQWKRVLTSCPGKAVMRRLSLQSTFSCQTNNPSCFLLQLAQPQLNLCPPLMMTSPIFSSLVLPCTMMRTTQHLL